MYKLAFYVPVSDAELVKNALFSVGAGRLGVYECCCYETPGIGQFKPLLGANPTIGSIGSVVKVNELKIEMTCSDDKIELAIQALKRIILTKCLLMKLLN